MEALSSPSLPSLEEWTMPLKIAPPSTSSTFSILKEAGSNLLHDLSSPTQWSSISASTHVSSTQMHREGEAKNRSSHWTKKYSAKATIALAVPKLHVEGISPPTVREDGNLRSS